MKGTPIKYHVSYATYGHKDERDIDQLGIPVMLEDMLWKSGSHLGLLCL